MSCIDCLSGDMALCRARFVTCVQRWDEKGERSHRPFTGMAACRRRSTYVTERTVLVLPLEALEATNDRTALSPSCSSRSTSLAEIVWTSAKWPVA